MDKELINIDSGNIIIYESDVNMIESEYIESLPDQSLIFKSSCFNGLLNLIYDRFLKNILRKDKRIDYQLSNAVFDNIYIPLCTRYNICPTVLQFVTIMLHIPIEHITDIKNGIYRSNGSEVTKSHTQAIKRWYSVTESIMLGKAVNESSIGSIFGLKAVYGYSDQSPIQLEVTKTEEHESPEEISLRHQNAFIPEKPEL